jgi:hypothetical protein
MESPSNHQARTRADGSLVYGSQAQPDARSMRGRDASLLTQQTPRLNLLLIGKDAGVSKVLETILADLADPIITCLPGDGLVLPETRVGTLILYDVGSLKYDDQRRLSEWLEGSLGRTQVVSTSEFPLLPRVQSGAFIDKLYYRLNTVCVDVSH